MFNSSNEDDTTYSVCVNYNKETDLISHKYTNDTLTTVSYTHLDVYKRQIIIFLNTSSPIMGAVIEHF